jgi:hypothetical protein
MMRRRCQAIITQTVDIHATVFVNVQKTFVLFKASTQ